MSSRRTDLVRARYGASPLHLLLVLCSFALTVYAGIRLLDGDAVMVAVWFVGAALVHDLLLLPLYTVTDRALQALLRRSPGGGHAQGRTRRARVNYVRVPAFISLVLLAVWYPLVLDRVERYSSYTGLDNAGIYWGRWLLITAVLFAVSAVCLVVGAWRGRSRDAEEGHDRPGNPTSQRES